MLEVKNLNAFYGAVQVLWDVSMNVEEGDIVCLLGSNGAGKSSLLRAFSNLAMIRRDGIINFLGESILKCPPHEIVAKGMSHVPEGRRIFSTMSVFENLRLGAYTKKAKEGMKDTLEWIYGLFPVLKERRDQRAGTLSGGERQMLAMGRGLMARPKLYLLDEPSLGLAPMLVRRIFELIKEIRDDGVTVLLLEQNARQALMLADRAYVLETGRIRTQGQAKDLLRDDEVRKAYLGL